MGFWTLWPDFIKRNTFSEILSLLRSCFNIIRMDFHPILWSIKIFSWSDSTFFTHVINFRKCPGRYEISTVSIGKPYIGAEWIFWLIQADFSPKTPNHSSEIFDFKNKIQESVLYHPETSSWQRQTSPNHFFVFGNIENISKTVFFPVKT